MSNSYWQELLKSKLRKAENLQDATREGKARQQQSLSVSFKCATELAEEVSRTPDWR